jgi:probable phosphoglycerate mutase
MTILTELVIVRHGEAVCNVTGVVGGDIGCTGLTELGHRQALQVAHRLAEEHAGEPFDSFHTTPRLRVRQTAEAIAARLRLAVTIEPDLRGPDHGASDGLRWEDVRERFGGNLRRYPDRRQAHDSETWHEYLARAQASLRSILARAARRILIVGHRETIEAAHLLLLGLGRGTSTRVGFLSDHAGIARWRLEADRYGQRVWKLAVHNDTMHLKAA